jgi:hypothetical protein
MGRVSQWAVRQPWWALLTWVVLMAAIVAASIAWGGEYNDDFELPNTESTTAQELLGELSGSAGTGAGLEGQVVWASESGTAIEADAEQAMTRVLTEVSVSEGVQCIVLPFEATPELGNGCPEQPADQAGGEEQGQGEPPAEEEPAEEPSEAAAGALAHFGQAGVSPDGSVAYATVTFEGETFDDLDNENILTALEPIEEQNGEDGLEVGANGVFAFVSGEEPS